MALWSVFKSTNLLQSDISSDTPAKQIYSLPADKLVLCLRVVFAKWIEASIGKVSPKTFFQGLQFQLQAIHRHTQVKDPRNLCHPNNLSKYIKLLSRYNSPQEIQSLYFKFLWCLKQEYNLVRLRNMDIELPLELDVQKFLEDQQDFNSLSESQTSRYSSLISAQIIHLAQIEADITQNISELKTSFQNFDYWYNEYKRTGTGNDISASSQSQENFILNLTFSKKLLEEGNSILIVKRSLEDKVNAICSLVLSMEKNFQAYLHHYEKLHIFSNRANDFSDDAQIEGMGAKVEETILLLRRLQELMVLLHLNFDFQRILAINHEVTITTKEQKPELLMPASYTSNFAVFKENLQKQEWSLYQIFTLVVDCQPPMVIMKGSRYTPISLRIFNHGNILGGNIKTEAYLVNEQTVQAIRASNVVPDCISTAGNIVIANRTTAGIDDIPKFKGVRGRGRLNRSKTFRHRRPAKEANQMIGGGRVELEEIYTPNKKCYLLEKELIITTIHRNARVNHRQPESSKSFRKTDEGCDNVTSEKVALLFVMKINFDNQEKKIWTISLPMIVAAHGSQNEKAWLTIAWDDAFAIPERQGFEVKKNIDWTQTLELLKGTFEVLVGDKLQPSHINYLKCKAEKYIPSFPNDMSKKALSEDRGGTISFWSWFYKALTVVKVNGHFHEAWKDGHIEGFIDYERAHDLLRNPAVEPGTFIVRFSDAEPGSLTLIFKACNQDIYKMQPVDVKLKSFSDCAVAFLRVLTVKESLQGKEVFLRVFPNTCKKVAFKKFYDASNKRISPEYVTIINMIPVLPRKHAEGENKSNDNEGETTSSSVQTQNGNIPANPGRSNGGLYVESQQPHTSLQGADFPSILNTSINSSNRLISEHLPMSIDDILGQETFL